MFKKLVAIAFAALITASAVTGCGNNSGATRADSRTETDSRDDGNTNETDASLNEEPTSADSQDGQKHYDALRYADGDLFSVKSVDPSKVNLRITLFRRYGRRRMDLRLCKAINLTLRITFVIMV